LPRRRPARKAGPPVHDDLVDRDFTADRPNALWLTDITEHRTNEGKLYCCAIKDVYSNRIVGYSLSDRMTAALAVSALRNAIALRPSGRDTDNSFGPRISISKQGLRPNFEAQRTHRIDGPGRRLRRQRGHGVVLFACSRRTCSIVSAGRHGRNCASPSSPGSSGPITAGVASASSDCLTPVEFEILETELQAA
jgi:putative transposase